MTAIRVHGVKDGPDETLIDMFAAEVIPKMSGEHGKIFQNFRPVRVTRARGYTLVELLLVIVIIAVLAGFVLIVNGSGSAKAEAAKVLSNMEAMKAALLLDSKQTISRTNDPLGSLVGQTATVILNTASRHTDTAFDRKYFDNVSITRVGDQIVLNLKIPANTGEAGNELRKKASQSSVFSYDQLQDMITLTIK
jgi:prepilin-type N-terminal cleavage/methylation domain-containing protein